MKKEPPTLYEVSGTGIQIRENETVTDYGRTSSHLTVIFSGSQEEGWSEVVTAVNMDKTVWAKIIA